MIFNLEQLAAWHEEQARELRNTGMDRVGVGYEAGPKRIAYLDSLEFHDHAAIVARSAIATYAAAVHVLRAGSGEPAIAAQAERGSPAPGLCISELRSRLTTTAAALAIALERIAARDDEAADLPWMQQQLERANQTLEHAR